MKNIIQIVLFLAIAGGLFYFFGLKNKEQLNEPSQQSQVNQADNLSNNTNNQQINNQGNGPSNDNQMKKEILQEGTGEPSKLGDKITVNYTGTLENGTQFDTSIGKTPFTFTLGQGVIEGWSQGLVGAKVGEKLKLTIPPELGYGSQGAGGVIPPNATLIFEIEVLKIN